MEVEVAAVDHMEEEEVVTMLIVADTEVVVVVEVGTLGFVMDLLVQEVAVVATIRIDVIHLRVETELDGDDKKLLKHT
jgi:hypothetical protein